MTSALIARRRPDIERFDGQDLELIRYGRYLEFGGRIRPDSTKESLPPIPGKRWTVFWTKADTFRWNFGAGGLELDRLLRGQWSLQSRCGGDRRFGPDSRLTGWATTHTDPTHLRRIEAHLRANLPHLEVQVIDIVATRCGDRIEIDARGRTCPAISARGTTILWDDGRRGYSLCP